MHFESVTVTDFDNYYPTNRHNVPVVYIKAEVVVNGILHEVTLEDDGYTSDEFNSELFKLTEFSDHVFNPDDEDYADNFIDGDDSNGLSDKGMAYYKMLYTDMLADQIQENPIIREFVEEYIDNCKYIQYNDILDEPEAEWPELDNAIVINEGYWTRMVNHPDFGIHLTVRHEGKKVRCMHRILGFNDELILSYGYVNLGRGPSVLCFCVCRPESLVDDPSEVILEVLFMGDRGSDAVKFLST